MAKNRWSEDLPMLRAIARLEGTSQNQDWLTPLVTETGLDLATVKASLRRLDGEYIGLRSVGSWQGGDMLRVLDVRLLPKGWQAIGQWPSPEDTLAALIEALQAAADETEDPEEKSAIHKTGDILRRRSGDLAMTLIATFIVKASGLE